jgi:hypothetical protein
LYNFIQSTFILTFENFNHSIQKATEPQGISVYLLAMWHDAHNDWDKAHGLVDNLNDATACWVHAYLHRKEGDPVNAAYWYRRAGKNMPVISLAQEWENIVLSLL